MQQSALCNAVPTRSVKTDLGTRIKYQQTTKSKSVTELAHFNSILRLIALLTVLHHKQRPKPVRKIILGDTNFFRPAFLHKRDQGSKYSQMRKKKHLHQQNAIGY